jgi:hypothetical protein
MDKHVFHEIYPCLDSFRLLYDFEIPRLVENYNKSNIPIYSIPVNDWRCVTLKAKINDIICIKNHLTLIYRRVK